MLDKEKFLSLSYLYIVKRPAQCWQEQISSHVESLENPNRLAPRDYCFKDVWHLSLQFPMVYKLYMVVQNLEVD
jgi:hypothetical protein